MRDISREEIEADLDSDYWETVNRWLERGDGIAVYQNQDFGSPQLGEKKYVSFGSTAAQLETEEPPQRLPDIGGAINWRYWLVGTYKGAPLGGGPVKVQ